MRKVRPPREERGNRLRPWSLVAIEYQRRHGQPMTRAAAETIGRKALKKLLEAIHTPLETR